MFLIDMHCDTILSLWEKGEDASLRKNDLSVDIEKMEQGHVLVQNFALFTHRKEETIPEKRTMDLMDRYWSELEQNADRLAPVFCFEDIERNARDHKISCLLTLEDGGVVFDDLAMLRNYYRMGVRMIALTWNYPNGIGHPNLSMGDFADYKQASLLQKADTENGLTEFGIRYIQEMERLGMIIDVSHLSDAGFWDVVKHTTKPFVASHSNARTICPVARNLDDDMIRALDQKGGVMGLNFCGDFLETHAAANGPSRVEAMVRHILYIRDIASINCIGIGTDFDGIHSDLEIPSSAHMWKLQEALRKAGLPQEDIEKVFYRNVLRVYEETL
ncbi:dipeptidase [uncultured Faecalicoccus sp.]|uniref:dipeptidase n=1 Tax=uncultured Faecalicoccus sp. TaxID=1971760 RepID=UPI0025E1724A|nr:dipeptidase [uncultured Faecalicoccus sp.]